MKGSEQLLQTVGDGDELPIRIRRDPRSRVGLDL
jgi:hypothetical protein